MPSDPRTHRFRATLPRRIPGGWRMTFGNDESHGEHISFSNRTPAPQQPARAGSYRKESLVSAVAVSLHRGIVSGPPLGTGARRKRHRIASLTLSVNCAGILLDWSYAAARLIGLSGEHSARSAVLTSGVRQRRIELLIRDATHNGTMRQRAILRDMKRHLGPEEELKW